MGLSGWQYCANINIDNTGNSNALSNYQQKVVLSISNFDFSKANSDGSDIRFLDNDDSTPLSYWIEGWDSSGQTATIWVKVPSIPASSNYTIYMYFGNASATSESNGDNTFAFFDDFSTKDTSKWNWPADWTIENGYAKQTYSSDWPPSGDLSHTFSSTIELTSGVGVMIETYVKNLGTVYAYDLQIGVTDSGTSYGTDWAVGAYDRIFGSSSTDWGEADTRNWNPVKLLVLDGLQKIWINGAKEASNTISITSISKIYITSKGQSYWDWIRVRKYTSTEPTTTVGTIRTVSNAIFFGCNF